MSYAMIALWAASFFNILGVAFNLYIYRRNRNAISIALRLTNKEPKQKDFFDFIAESGANFLREELCGKK